MASPFRTRQVAQCIKLGGVVAYPTEAIWGLGCDPMNGLAVKRLLKIKQRPMHKGLILIASDISQLSPYIKPLSSSLLDKVQATWPGPYTWLLPTNDNAPVWLRGQHKTLAVRVSDHPDVIALCNTLGRAIVSTSANISGKHPAMSQLQVRKRCPDVDAILPGKLGGRSGPSTIIDGISGAIIR